MGLKQDGSASTAAQPVTMTSTQTLRLAHALPEIRRLARAVEAFAASNGVPAKAAHHINLAADELITNAINYGDAGDAGRIVVTLRREPDRMVMVISHRGLAFDPTTEVAAPDLDSDVEDRAVGGLGVHFAKTLLDGLSYVRHRGANRLILTKKL